MGLFSRFKKSDVLYYPGCRTYIKHKENMELYKKIFSKLGINLLTMDKNFCCGLPALELGYEQEARKIARKNLEFLKENNIRKIVTSCPSCYKMLTQDYPEMLPDWDIEIENTWKFILEKLANKPKIIKKKREETITYHDSCYLGRHCGIYDEPRMILELIGYNITEMSDTKEKSICCGSCGGLMTVNPELADKIAYQRLLQAKRAKIKKMIVCSFENYDLLKRNSEDIEVLELSEALAHALGIKIKFIEEKIPTEEEQMIIDLEADKRIKEELKDEYLEDEYMEETEEDIL